MTTAAPQSLHDLGFSEQGALSLIVGWGFFMTLTTILAGSITDALGLRRTLLSLPAFDVVRPSRTDRGGDDA